MPSSPLTPVTAQPARYRLAPEERIAEVLFGLIMVLTFTGSLSVAEAGRNAVRTMLIGALGCNIAWGIIDGILYLMGRLSERRQGVRAMIAVRQSIAPADAHAVIADALPPVIAATLGPAEYESIRQKLAALPEPDTRRHIRKDEWSGALAVFLWVFFATLPVALPFVFMNDVARAMRVSNFIAVSMLFLAGFCFGRISGHNRWAAGLVMVILGLALVSLTIALGG